MAGEHPKLSPKSERTNQKKKGFSVGPDNLPDGVHRRKGNENISFIRSHADVGTVQYKRSNRTLFEKPRSKNPTTGSSPVSQSSTPQAMDMALGQMKRH